MVLARVPIEGNGCSNFGANISMEFLFPLIILHIRKNSIQFQEDDLSEKSLQRISVLFFMCRGITQGKLLCRTLRLSVVGQY